MIQRILFLLVAFVFLPPQGVFATGTVMLFPTQCSTPSWANCAYLGADDTNYATVTQPYPNFDDWWMEQYGFGDWGVPTNSAITGIEISTVAKSSQQATPRQLTLALSKDGGATWQINGVNNDLLWINPPTTLTSHTYDTNKYNSTAFNNYGWQASDFGTSNNFRVKIMPAVNQTTTWTVDYISVVIRYETWSNTINLDNAVASPSGQYVSYDLSGSTSTSSATMKCTLSFHESCVTETGISWNPSQAIATILLDGASSQSGTIDLGGGVYKGYNWGFNDNTWIADDVRFPYHPKHACDYPMDTLCTDGDQVIIDIKNSGQFSAPIGLMGESYTEPEPTSPLAWVVWKAKQTLTELFIPHEDIITQQKTYLYQLISTKAPIAYVQSALALDWSSGQMSTSTPTIHIALASNANGIIPDINWTAPEFFKGTMSTLRTGLSIVLWMSFVLYIVIKLRTML